jgi:hypothetical protein
MPVMLASWEVEIGRISMVTQVKHNKIVIQVGLGKKQDSISNIIRVKKTGEVVPSGRAPA